MSTDMLKKKTCKCIKTAHEACGDGLRQTAVKNLVCVWETWNAFTFITSLSAVAAPIFISPPPFAFETASEGDNMQSDQYLRAAEREMITIIFADSLMSPPVGVTQKNNFPLEETWRM